MPAILKKAVFLQKTVAGFAKTPVFRQELGFPAIKPRNFLTIQVFWRKWQWLLKKRASLKKRSLIFARARWAGS
jgi:hypothetical protein